MEHVYSVLIPNLIESSNLSSDIGLLEWILDKKCLCRVSNLNLLAFTASTEITSNNFDYSYNNIYVIDLNLPNQPHLIKNHQSKITSLEWNNTGQKLILGDVDGNIEVWCRKDYLINQWQLNYKETCFEGETVLSIIWFNNSLNYKINLNKHDQQHIPYNEKFNLSKFESTVKQFGKKSADGFICISNSGIIWSICFSSDGQVLKAKQILGDMQNRIQLIDVNYRSNGDLIIATSNGLVDYPINLYTVTIKSEQTDCLEINKLIIKCDNFNSFFAKSNNQLNNEINKNHKFITHLKFVKKEESNSILVACASSMGSSLELWELQDRPCQINRHFLTNDTPIVPKTIKQWIFITGCNYSHRIVSLSVMNSSIYNTDQNLQPFIIVAYKDNIIKCLIKENLQLASSLNLNSAYKTPLNENNKLISNLLNVEDMQFTWSGSGLIILDNASQIFLYKMPAIIDYRSELYKPTFVVMLLEYSMLNSYDWWDILLTIKPNLIESICDRFTENFKSQHSSIQQKYQHKYLAIKGSIYRISNVISIGLNKSGDCYAFALLYSITNLIRMVLRTSANKNLDKEGPIEYITKVVQNNVNELQLTKILIILENVNKDCFVETIVSQSLQHLIQWIGDLALYLVGSYPQQQQNIRFPGGGLIYDKLAINTLRELLVIIQIWGLLNENCLPVFTKLNDNNDVMACLYKLLTKSLSFTNTEPDEQFIEECCSLSNDVLIPQLDLTLKARGIISPPLYFQDWPLALNYGKEASFLSYPGYKIPAVDGAIDCNLNNKIDVIRRIGLGNLAGIKNMNIRKCTRCESISLLEAVLKTQATIAWDQTWKKQCICGGHWENLVNRSLENIGQLNN